MFDSNPTKSCSREFDQRLATFVLDNGLEPSDKRV